MSVVTYVTDIIEGRRKSNIVKGVLYALSSLFRMAVGVRNFAFDNNWLKKKSVAVPVISIGNIIAGGTGKTPLIELLAHDLKNSIKVSVLSRGYRSKIEKSGKNLYLEKKSHLNPTICGDEPYMLSQALPDVTFFVGKNRVLNAQRAVYQEADILLLDDGMQYRSLHRDFEIVMLHGDDLYGKGYFLPRGYLRDSPERLKNADAIFVNHLRKNSQIEAITQEVKRWTNLPIIATRMVPKYIELFSKEQINKLNGNRVGVFCGLGKPSSFIETVKEMGAEVVDTLILQDHKSPKKEEARRFIDRCIERGCDLIICSEKDWIKLPTNIEWSIPIGFLKAEMKIVHGLDQYNNILKKIRSLTLKRSENETMD